ASNIAFDAWQWSSRVDHRLNKRNTLGGRYLFDDSFNFGDGQVNPVGLNTVTKLRRQSAAAFLNSTVLPTVFNELRFSYHRSATDIEALNPNTARIPSVEVNESG